MARKTRRRVAWLVGGLALVAAIVGMFVLGPNKNAAPGSRAYAGSPPRSRCSWGSPRACPRSALRVLSGGFLLVGSLMFTAGAFVGLRDPARARERRIARGVNTTGPRSWAEAFHLSALLVGVGLFLVLLGIVLHPRASL